MQPTTRKWFSQVIITTKIGKTPAAVNRRTGVLYINPITFAELSPTQQEFVILHELGHYVLNTPNELEADKAAFHWYARKGLPLSDSLKTLLLVLDSDSKSHQIRVKKLRDEIAFFEKVVNKNHQFNQKLNYTQRMANVQYSQQQAAEAFREAYNRGDFDTAQKAAQILCYHASPEDKLKTAAQLGAMLDRMEANGFCSGCNAMDDEDDYEDEMDGEDISDEFASAFADGDLDYIGGQNKPKKRKGGFQKVFGSILETVGSAAGIKAVADAGSRIREKGLQKSAAAGDAPVGVPDPRVLLAEQQKAEAEQKQKEDEEKRKKEAEEKKKKMWMIGGGIVALILIAIAIWFFTCKKAEAA